MQSFIFNCPGCNHGIEVQEDWQGKAVKCPHCGLSVVVPAKSMYTTTNATPEVTEMADTAPSTEIKVMCPECNANYAVGKSLSNTLITCPQCGTKVTVPPCAEFETISCPYCNMIGYVDKPASTVRCFACKKTFSLNCDLPIAAEQKLPAKKIKSYTMNAENMKKDVNKTGYFAVLTNCLTPSRHDLSEILDIYGMRDEQEKSFMFIKSEQDGRRLRTSKEESANGRLFIQFVALILNCIIYRTFSASKKLQNLFPTRQHMLDELRSIRLICYPQKAKLITEIVGRQVDIFKEFHLPVPMKLLPKERRKEFEDTTGQAR